MRKVLVWTLVFMVTTMVLGCGKKSTEADVRVLVIVSGDHQEEILGSTLTQPFVVLVTDKKGQAVVGQRVDFKIVEGNGSLSVETTTTDDDGNASTVLTFGNQEEQV